MLGGVAVAAMPLMSLMIIKWGASAIPLLIFAQFIERPEWKRVLSQWRRIVILCLLGMAGYSFMFYQALRTTSPINASLINAFNPCLIAVAALFFLKEKLTSIKVMGIFVSLIGVLWVITQGELMLLFTQSFNPGDVWMLGVICCWTAYTIILRKASYLPPITNAALQMACFTALMSPAALYYGITLPSTSAAQWSLAYIAIFPSAIAYALWGIGAKTIPPAQAGQFLNLVVPFTAIMTVISGTPISQSEILGGLLILLGVCITSHDPKSTPISAPANKTVFNKP